MEINKDHSGHCNVYPVGEVEVVEFRYCGSLHLTRSIEAVKTRRGEDAKYVVSKPYRAKVKLRADGQCFWHCICVPKGYMSDLASVPRLFRFVVSRAGPYLEACVIHDWLYEAWIVTRQIPDIAMKSFADDILRMAMRQANVKKHIIYTIHKAVVIGGGKMFRQGGNASKPPITEVIAPTDKYESCCYDDEGTTLTHDEHHQ